MSLFHQLGIFMDVEVPAILFNSVNTDLPISKLLALFQSTFCFFRQKLNAHHQQAAGHY
jgi:hypothetical protein